MSSDDADVTANIDADSAALAYYGRCLSFLAALVVGIALIILVGIFL